jgi:hypothetical protein
VTPIFTPSFAAAASIALNPLPAGAQRRWLPLPIDSSASAGILPLPYLSSSAGGTSFPVALDGSTAL